MKRILFFQALVVATGFFAACTQDNVHMPETEIITVDKDVPAEDEVFDDSLYYEGTLTSSVPAMASQMNPVTTADYMQFKNMTGKTAGYATLVLGQFNITVETMNMHITIGEMAIDSVRYAFDSNGNGMFFKKNFEVMSGTRPTTGSLSGTFDASGSVQMTMDYKPGTMPFLCHSELEAVRK
jgi:hypothetical protein